MVGVFITTAVFSTFAYIWFFLCLVVISPGIVELWEAGLTLGFMIILVIQAYSCDKCHEKNESEEDKKKHEAHQVTKAAMRIMARKFGIRTLLEVGQGEKNPSKVPGTPDLTKADISMALEYYETLLKKPAAEAELDELLECLMPDNAVERIAYRRSVNVANNRNFARLSNEDKGEAAIEKTSTAQDSKTVGFKHMRYEVSESNGSVTITVQKRIPQDFSFWIRTIDGTAKSGQDYEEKNEYMTMHANEEERTIQINIVNDAEWEPDEEFKVLLLDETK